MVDRPDGFAVGYFETETSGFEEAGANMDAYEVNTKWQVRACVGSWLSRWTWTSADPTVEKAGPGIGADRGWKVTADYEPGDSCLNSPLTGVCLHPSESAGREGGVLGEDVGRARGGGGAEPPLTWPCVVRRLP